MEWVTVAVVFGGLTGLLIYQQQSYSKLLKDLVDRLMARDLRDYEQSKNPPPPRVVIKKDAPPTEDLNRILG